MSKHKFTGDRSDMAHQIKTATGRSPGREPLMHNLPPVAGDCCEGEERNDYTVVHSPGCRHTVESARASLLRIIGEK